MSAEQRRAEHYESHKDDPDEWGEPEPAPKERRRLASMISVRLSPDEAEIIRKAAKSHDLSVSAFLRRAALAEAADETTFVPAQATGPSSRPSDASVVILAGPQDVDPALLGVTSGSHLRRV